MMSDATTVYIVDDDEPIRDSISMLLDTVDIAHRTYANAQLFLDDFDATNKGCLVLDIRMPGMSGLELQEKLIDMHASIPIVFITGHGDIPMAVDAMRRGAINFIRKPFRDQELLDQIHEALSVDAATRSNQATLEQARARTSDLTPREEEVFERVAAGQANKVIAIELGISERTVEIHRSQVMHKSKSRSLADLVRLKLQLEDSDADS
jgi:FixJ family two-component response regulator